MIHLTQWLAAQPSSSTTDDEIRIIVSHAAECAECRLLLASDAEMRRRLALLRVGEPRIDVLGQVMQRIDDEA